jgi:hypothetical protein
VSLPGASRACRTAPRPNFPCGLLPVITRDQRHADSDLPRPGGERACNEFVHDSRMSQGGMAVVVRSSQAMILQSVCTRRVALGTMESPVSVAHVFTMVLMAIYEGLS